MGTSLQPILLLIITAIAVPVNGYAVESTTHVWTFDHDSLDALPSEFQVGTLFDGRPVGEWKVLDTDRAKSPPRVQGQLMGKGAEHAYKMVLIDRIKASDIELEVSFLPIEDKADMGGGLIWRATDDRNYYLTRATRWSRIFGSTASSRARDTSSGTSIRSSISGVAYPPRHHERMPSPSLF